MDSAETSDLKPKDLRARIQARAKLTTQIQPEITPIYGRRARALASTPESIEISPSRRDNFLGTKSFFGGGDNLTDISQNSSPLHKEFPFQSDPLIERSQIQPEPSKLLSSEPKTIEAPQLKSILPSNLVSRKLFGGVSLSLITALIGAVVLVVMLMLKVNQLENRTKKLEDIVLSGTWSNDAETYNHKPLEDGLASNTDKINTLETSVIPDIQYNLSANINKTDNLETVVIPDIQDNLSANIDKTENLESVVIPGIEADLSANVAKTDNLETVTIPAIQSDLTANIAKTDNLETVVIPSIQDDLSDNIAKTNNLETVTIPAIQSDLSANVAKTNNLETVTIPSIQSDLTANVAKTTTIETVTIPAIQSDLTANIAKTTTIETVTIPAIQTSLTANIAKTTNIETVTIPAIQTSLTANIAKTTNLETVTIPAIQTSLTANIAKTTTLENAIKALPKVYFGKTAATAWTVYTSYGIVQTVDISGHGFTNPPTVITSLSGLSSHWVTVGASSVYGLSKNSFTVYIRWADGANSTPLAPSDAVSLGWQLQYALFSNDT